MKCGTYGSRDKFAPGRKLPCGLDEPPVKCEPNSAAMRCWRARVRTICSVSDNWPAVSVMSRSNY